MPRIRTIKPEFPQSESMGRVSRDARLLMVNLWTLCDDEGRTRAASRMLASLLYPYDNDAPKLIERWLVELEQENCIQRYEVEGSTYLVIVNWLKHQKIDRPSPSRLPPPPEGSRGLANNREGSSTDLGPRTMDLDQGSGPRKEATRDKRATLHPMPADWQPSEDMHAKLRERGYSDHEIAWQRDRCAAHFVESGKRRPGWDATFFKWITSDPPGKHSARHAQGNGPGNGGVIANLSRYLSSLDPE